MSSPDVLAGAPAARRGLQRRTVAVLMLTQVAGGVGMGAALAVGGLIAQDLSGSQTWAGLATTMVTLGAALFALPLAGLAARRGRRAGLALGWFCAALGAAAVIAATEAGSFTLFLAGMVLVGAGTATGLQSRHAATDLAGERTRGRDLSIVLWATTVGSVAGPNLTGPGAAVARGLGIAELLGPVVFTAAGFALAGTLTVLLLRPDPLLSARTPTGAGEPETPSAPQRTLAQVLRLIGRTPGALLAVVGIVASHTVMVAVMTMTPVHMSHHGAELTVIGLTISLHIAGMYALSPVVGWLTDRFGPIPVLLAGQAVLVLSAVVSGTAGHDEGAVTAGLVLLGLGWSFGVVSGSALLARSLRPEERPRAQGVCDLVMSLGGASAGALSGVVLAQAGFGGLNLFAAVFTLPVLLLALRVLRDRSDSPSGRGGRRTLRETRR